MVRAGYIEFGKELNSNLGVPQGSIVSPILSNLILHELDTYIESLQAEQAITNRGQKPTVRNPEYDRIQDRIQAIRKTERRWKERGIPLDGVRMEERRLLFQLRATLPSSIPNGRIATFQYVRYADDWLIGISGSRAFAEELKEKINSFLSTLKLDLSLEKTLITNSGDSTAKFLGVEIRRVSSVKGQIKHIPN